MMHKFTFSALLMSSFLLAGCHQTYSSEYLLQHPNTLEAEFSKCQNDSADASYCDVVKQTTQQFVALANVRRDDPELFGKQILQAELDMVNAKEQYAQTKDALTKSKNNHDADAVITAATEKLNQAKQAYKDKTVKVKTLLAVVAATSSDAL